MNRVKKMMLVPFNESQRECVNNQSQKESFNYLNDSLLTDHQKLILYNKSINKHNSIPKTQEISVNTDPLDDSHSAFSDKDTKHILIPKTHDISVNTDTIIDTDTSIQNKLLNKQKELESLLEIEKDLSQYYRNIAEEYELDLDKSSHTKFKNLLDKHRHAPKSSYVQHAHYIPNELDEVPDGKIRRHYTFPSNKRNHIASEWKPFTKKNI
jgi:hypothetical protein